ncbi:hypothetical protein KIF24_13230 [Micromonospora sp. Llam7]|uniref:PEP/pyruvate-binding domain-containing protein n=1 Tax=Micromonospora tarapacensis TaxID=2835305 RepID=UPI001C831DC4|nr:PEP/pyruvate-binding domain-containing protein [Micromonospora tarapacensis]MBX7266892.1 hypothetical protein [Micromonospora tarapacensis]
MAELLIDLAEFADPAPARVGGKAAGLCAARALGHRVPPAAVLATDVVPADAGSGWIRTATTQVLAWAREREVAHLVVRSSADVEDRGRHSYAGVFRSAFSRARPEDVAAALSTVLAGATGPVRHAYETAAGLAGRAGRLAILVQATVPARSSGVAFGWPGSGGRQLRVDGTWGLATQLLGGIGTGDSHRSDAVPADRIGPKPLAIYPILDDRHRPGDLVAVDPGVPPDGKVVYVDGPAGLAYVRLAPGHASRGCLHPRLLAGLAAVLAEPPPGYRTGLDVEWVEDQHGTLWLVQLRPMTAVPPPPAREPVGPADGRTLRGEPGAPGRWRGPVSHADAISGYPPADGRVLVCGAARPELLPAIARAAAIVSSDGGVLCHVAILARELGKPCVVGVPDAERLLTEGATVTVDGTAGTVSLTGEGPTTASSAAAAAVDGGPGPPSGDVTVGFLPPDRPIDPADPLLADAEVVVLVLTTHGPVTPAMLTDAPGHLVLCTTAGVAAERAGWRIRHRVGRWSVLARPTLGEHLIRAVLRALPEAGDA